MRDGPRKESQKFVIALPYEAPVSQREVVSSHQSLKDSQDGRMIQVTIFHLPRKVSTRVHIRQASSIEFWLGSDGPFGLGQVSHQERSDRGDTNVHHDK